MSSPTTATGEGSRPGRDEPARAGAPRRRHRPRGAQPPSRRADGPPAEAPGSRRAGTSPGRSRTGPAPSPSPTAAQEWTGGPPGRRGPPRPGPDGARPSGRDRPRRRAGLGTAARLDDLRRRRPRGRRPAGPDRDLAGAPRQGGPAGQRAPRPRGLAGPGRVRHRLPARAVDRAEVRGHRRPAARRRPGAAAVPRPLLEAPHRRARPDRQRQRGVRRPLAAARRRGRPQVRRLVQDPPVQGLLLGTDDGDEFWTGGRPPGRGPARRPPAAADRAPRPAAHRRWSARSPVAERCRERRPTADGRQPAPPHGPACATCCPCCAHRRAGAAAGLSLVGAAAAGPAGPVGRVIDAVGAAGRSAGRAPPRLVLVASALLGPRSSTCSSARRRASSSPPGGPSPTGCCGCPSPSTTAAHRRPDVAGGADTTLLRATVTSGVVDVAGSVVMGVGALVAMALVDVWLLLVTVVSVAIGRRRRPRLRGVRGCRGRRRRRSAP